MTNIILHGILAKEFGENFKMKIYKAANTIKAIDVNRKNFTKRIFELSREGLNYTIIVDGQKITELEELNIQKEPKEVHLVPMIVGSGPLGVGSALISVFSFGSVSMAAAAGIGGGLLASVVGSIALTAVSIGLQMLLAPKPEDQGPISATTKALRDSFMFSNKVNVSNQGSPIPVGYGRLKIGSQVIQASIKSYSQSLESTNIMSKDLSIFKDDFLVPQAQITSSVIR